MKTSLSSDPCLALYLVKMFFFPLEGQLFSSTRWCFESDLRPVFLPLYLSQSQTEDPETVRSAPRLRTSSETSVPGSCPSGSNRHPSLPSLKSEGSPKGSTSRSSLDWQTLTSPYNTNRPTDPLAHSGTYHSIRKGEGKGETPQGKNQVLQKFTISTGSQSLTSDSIFL